MIAIIALMGAGDETARFNQLGHKMMCKCGCNQILLECNHVGCEYSERMRGELKVAMLRGDSAETLARQRRFVEAFVRPRGLTVSATETMADAIEQLGRDRPSAEVVHPSWVGRIGLWAKTDSTSLFKDFTWTPAK